MRGGTAPPLQHGPDGATNGDHDIGGAGGGGEELLVEGFSQHWAGPTPGPPVERAPYEIQFATPPKVTELDGYLTVDTGAWHFHLCVNDHRGSRSAELARIRRVSRAAFFKTEGGSCAPATWGLRLWNGRGEQMITILFPNPHFDAKWQRLREPRWEKTALWQELRRRYASR